MKFRVLPILDLLLDFYQQERSPERFQAYLQMVYDRQKDQLRLPLPFFNPMAKDHVIAHLQTLQNLASEAILADCCTLVNDSFQLEQNLPEKDFQILLSLADDLHGGWTNQYSTHYSNTFSPKGLFNHQYCTALFWTSETQTRELVRKRCLETLWRTIYHTQYNYPITLLEHLQQEAFVQLKVGAQVPALQDEEWLLIQEMFKANKDDDARATIIPFLYGDLASHTLGYPELGLGNYLGLRLAQKLIS